MSWSDQFKELTSKTHTDQAIWWLNGYWHEGAESEAENIWVFTHEFIELETGKPVLYGSKKRTIEQKCDLDEMQAHRFLEKVGETLTVKELRKKLKKLDIDSNNRLALSEYLLSKYSKTPQELVETNQGGVPPEEMEAAEGKVNFASDSLNTATEAATEAKEAKSAADKNASDAAKALTASEKAAAEAKEALDKSTKAAEEAKVALANSVKAEEDAKEATKAQEKAEHEAKELAKEILAATQALEAEEKAYNDKIEVLEKKTNDSNLSTVKRGSYIQQLAQLKAEDPLPLRKAKLTQTAALKKQKKKTKQLAKLTAKTKQQEEKAKEEAAKSAEAKKEADAAAVAAAEAKKEADAAAVAAAEAKASADESAQAAAESEQKASDALDAAKAAFDEARQALEDLKNSDTPPSGRIWWMQRVMQEKEKFMPRRKKKK